MVPPLIGVFGFVTPEGLTIRVQSERLQVGRSALLGILLLSSAAGGLLMASEVEPSRPVDRLVRIPAGAQAPSAVARQFAEQLGVSIDVSAVPDEPIDGLSGASPFWVALERLAERTGTHIAIAGGRPTLRPGRAGVPSFISGPIRVSAREVLIRGDLESGRSTCDLQLQVLWAPWVHAYRIDTAPATCSVEDDQGRAVRVAPGNSRTFTSGTSAAVMVRLTDVPRSVKSLTLRGTIHLTVANELLAFEWSALKPGRTPAQKGVVVEVLRSFRDGKDWVVVVKTPGPAGSAKWQSFESSYWARNNTLDLVPPGGERIRGEAVEFNDDSIRYRFRDQGASVTEQWKLNYRTPGPMYEAPVSFELKNVPLP